MSLHRSWRSWLPIALVAFGSALFLLTPALDLDMTGLVGLVLGTWVAYPAGVALLLICVYMVHTHRKPFLLRIDEAGVVWRADGAGGSSANRTTRRGGPSTLGRQCGAVRPHSSPSSRRSAWSCS